MMTFAEEMKRITRENLVKSQSSVFQEIMFKIKERAKEGLSLLIVKYNHKFYNFEHFEQVAAQLKSRPYEFEVSITCEESEYYMRIFWGY